MLEHTPFQILIKEFESEMCEIAKDKKNEILELFTNNNEISSYKEFKDIKYLIQRACSQGDLELLEIYLNKEIQIYTKSCRLSFKINKAKKTASLFKVLELCDNLIVPRSIEYEGENYLVTSIISSGESSHKLIKRIEFPSNSAVHTFYEGSFYTSNVESISIPPSLFEMKEGCCECADKLTKITISESNNRFSFINGKYLVGKSDSKNEDFDVFMFASRDIEEVQIPSNIKIISNYAFRKCSQLIKVEFSTNSNLRVIGESAFEFTNITEISIPPNVTMICKSAFYNCRQLSKVYIPKNSNLRTIGELAFAYTKVIELYIPSGLVEMKEGWCLNADKLTKITISESNNRFSFIDGKYLVGKSDDKNEDFDVLMFASRDIEEAQIPSNIKIISNYAFAFCLHLTKVDIPENSNLQIIGRFAFIHTKITKIYIPSNVSAIGDSAFHYCNQLSIVEISANSNLQTIGKYAFSYTKIAEISIPSNVSMISECAFGGCGHLSKVEIQKNSNLQTIGKSAFENTNVSEIYLPSNLTELGQRWCLNAHKLKKITISESNNRFSFIDDKSLAGKSDDKNEDFDVLMFARGDIEKAQIPSNIKIISNYAFAFCRNLSIVEFSANSNLRTIGESAFERTNITEIFIPSNVSTICKCAFSDCAQLSKIEIPTNSKLQSIGECAFRGTKITEIYIPPNLTKLNDKWCFNVDKLTKITISESNNRFSFIEGKYLVGKSDDKNEDFDVLMFASRDIEEAQIPSNIKIISNYAFRKCSQLIKVEFSTNSNLRVIGESAFEFTNITEISIPPNVSTISKCAFNDCAQLSKVEIPTNSKLQSIGERAFQGTKITEIFIPSILIELKDEWCSNLVNVTISESNNRFSFKDDKYLVGKSNEGNENFDILLSAHQDIEEALIPSDIKIITRFAFKSCSNLSKVGFSTNSNMRTIGEYVFAFLNIKEISIPPSVSMICEFAFCECNQLSKFEIPENSNLLAIGERAFQGTKIKKILIPSNVSIICGYAFYDCKKLSEVEIATNSNLQTIGERAFQGTRINKIFIPPNVSTIDDSGFAVCQKLSKVEISPNSNLQTIGNRAFHGTKITSIFITSNVSKIGENAFGFCQDLQILEISEDSKLTSLDKSLFKYCRKVIVMITQKISKVINLN